MNDRKEGEKWANDKGKENTENERWKRKRKEIREKNGEMTKGGPFKIFLLRLLHSL